MEKENVLEIEFLKVWDKWAWQITKNKLKMEDNEFFIKNNTKLILKVGRQIDEYIICIEDNYKNIREFELITNEEKECIENFVNLVNQKYGITRRWRAKENEEYYFLDGKCEIWSTIEEKKKVDNTFFEQGNYFKTKGEAEKVKEELDKFWERVRAGEIRE